MCIVGAGYTGLWTAWWLHRLRPELKIVVVEATFAGFGASGRNGGWLSGLMPGDRNLLAQQHGGREGVIALQRALEAAVDDVIAACGEEGIDADIVKGGTMVAATNPAQLRRLHAGLVADREWGVGPEDAWPLDAAEVAARLHIEGAVGGRFSPHCARIQPAKLARSLADAVERAGIDIFESTPVVAIEPHRVETVHGTVKARFVVRATEGFTASLKGEGRALLPMNSSIVVTAPLTDDQWGAIGWSGMETVSTAAHAYLYSQRTADGRIAIGGRGVPYRFGSRTDVDGATQAATVEALEESLHQLWPSLRGVPIDHAWCGVLGVARDWCPSVGLDPVTGTAWAGGYVGDGVTTAHLAGRTVAELIAGEDTELTRLPWVGHVSPRWEPEPFRWLGVKGIYLLYRAADKAEAKRASAATSGWARLGDLISNRP